MECTQTKTDARFTVYVDKGIHGFPLLKPQRRTCRTCLNEDKVKNARTTKARHLRQNAESCKNELTHQKHPSLHLRIFKAQLINLDISLKYEEKKNYLLQVSQISISVL